MDILTDVRFVFMTDRVFDYILFALKWLSILKLYVTAIVSNLLSIQWI